MDVLKSTVVFTKSKLKLILPPPERKKKISQISLLRNEHISVPPQVKKQTVPKSIQVNSSSTRPRKWSQFLCMFPIYLLQLCYGMNSGFPAILTPQLGEPCSEFTITPDQESWIVSLDNILTPLICITSGLLQQKFGPSRILMFSCFPYSFGWITAASAKTPIQLYVSRILVGVSHALLTTTVYTVEMSSRDMRGTFSMLESVLRCAGCVLVYSLGLSFRWWQIASLAPLIPMLAFFCFIFVPESPVFLVGRGRLKEAEENLIRIYGPHHECEQEVILINENLQVQKQSRSCKRDYIRNFQDYPEIYKPFLIILFLSFIQQFSGVSVIRAYVVKIFDEVFRDSSDRTVFNATESLATNLVTDNDIKVAMCSEDSLTSRMAYISAIVIGVCRLLSSLTLARLLQSYPRRLMYFVSTFLTVLCLFSFSTFSYLISHYTTTLSHYPISPLYLSIFKWSSLVTACLLVFSVQLGVQTLPFMLSGELFPSDVRAVCKGLTRAVTCVLIVLSLKLYPALEENLTIFGTFGMFGGILLFLSPLVYFTLPETKDLGLEMIRHYFTPTVTTWYTDES